MSRPRDGVAESIKQYRTLNPTVIVFILVIINLLLELRAHPFAPGAAGLVVPAGFVILALWAGDLAYTECLFYPDRLVWRHLVTRTEIPYAEITAVTVTGHGQWIEVQTEDKTIAWGHEIPVTVTAGVLTDLAAAAPQAQWDERVKPLSPKIIRSMKFTRTATFVVACAILGIGALPLLVPLVRSALR